MAWTTAGGQTNPTNGTVIADSGQLPTGVHRLGLLVSCTARCTVEVQHRNAANGATIWGHLFQIAADSPMNLSLPITIENVNERVRIVMGANLTGSVQASIRV